MASTALSSLSFSLSTSTPHSSSQMRHLVSCAAATAPALLKRPVVSAAAKKAAACTTLSTTCTTTTSAALLHDDNFSLVSSPSLEALRHDNYSLVSSPSLEMLRRTEQLHKRHGLSTAGPSTHALLPAQLDLDAFPTCSFNCSACSSCPSSNPCTTTTTTTTITATATIERPSATRRRPSQPSIHPPSAASTAATDSVRRGGLIPSDVMTALLRERLARVDDARTWILDGYPRTEDQVESLFSLSSQLSPSTSSTPLANLVFVEMQADDVCVRARIAARRTHSAVVREDDASDSVIDTRLRTYRKQLPAILSALRRHNATAVHVDATAGKQATLDACVHALGALHRNRVNVVLIGPPGVGKGTLATQLAAALNAEHVSTGELVRQAMAADQQAQAQPHAQPLALAQAQAQSQLQTLTTATTTTTTDDEEDTTLAFPSQLVAGFA